MNVIVKECSGPWQDVRGRMVRETWELLQVPEAGNHSHPRSPESMPGKPKVIAVCLLACFNISGFQPGGGRGRRRQQEPAKTSDYGNARALLSLEGQV